MQKESVMDIELIRGWLNDYAIGILSIGSNENISLKEKLAYIQIGRDILAKLIVAKTKTVAKNSGVQEPSLN
jgi:hypothetical protein